MNSDLDRVYVLGDWGTSRLRLFLIRDGVILDRRYGPGIGQLDAPPSDVLTHLLVGWEDVADITLCGMAGARTGLVEAPYVHCPAGSSLWRENMAHTAVGLIPACVAPGFCHRDAEGTPDVMRGEETQIFGSMMLDATLATGHRRFVLPGTHSKWAEINDGTIEGFRTWFTGELHALLTTRSTLAGGEGGCPENFDLGFVRGLERFDTPIHAALFEARAARLLDGRTDVWAKGYLSGLLIGAEVAAYPTQIEESVLIGDSALCALYARAFDAIGQTYRVIDGDEAALAGLKLAKGHFA